MKIKVKIEIYNILIKLHIKTQHYKQVTLISSLALLTLLPVIFIQILEEDFGQIK